jgi:serine/threonine protein kinase
VGEFQVAQMLVGRYELDIPLGSGAMGEVWRGRDLATGRPVAVKLVKLASIDDQARVAVTIARFRREADTLARLRHPNIVSALAAGQVGKELYMVMELAEGISLDALLNRRQANRLGMFPVENVLHIAGQTCSGLAAAHAAGVVHRDIKPSNLMVSDRGHLMIVDFGIARLLEDSSPRLTAPSETVGTLSYMSPEQAAGIDVDGRSDLYSFGCVLYELLAGRPPFVAEIPITLMHMHLQERPVPMRNVRADLPDGLPELVDRLLEKDRGARPQDAGHVVRMLAGIRDNAGRATPEREANRRTLLLEDGDSTVPAGPGPEVNRTIVLADNPGQRPRQGQVAPGPDGYRPAPRDDDWSPQGRTLRLPDQSEQGTPPFQPLRQPADYGSGGGGTRPDRGKRQSNGGPVAWPTVPRRRRSRRLAGLLSSLLTFAIVAGIGAYVWNKTHQTLKVTSATVVVADPGKITCNATVDVVGTIFTNGKGGPVTYQWTKDGQNLPTGTVTAASGQQQVRVDLKWNLRGKGTHHAVAIFQVFTPNVISAQSASFTYECG